MYFYSKFLIHFTLALGLCFGARHLVAEPTSSANYQEAMVMAERIAAHNSQWLVYRAKGDSMGDFFGSSSLLLVKKATIREIRRDMIVVYRSPRGESIAHKVVENRGPWLRTAGVVNSQPTILASSIKRRKV